MAAEGTMASKSTGAAVADVEFDIDAVPVAGGAIRKLPGRAAKTAAKGKYKAATTIASSQGSVSQDPRNPDA